VHRCCRVAQKHQKHKKKKKKRIQAFSEAVTKKKKTRKKKEKKKKKKKIGEKKRKNRLLRPPYSILLSCLILNSIHISRAENNRSQHWWYSVWWGDTTGGKGRKTYIWLEAGALGGQWNKVAEDKPNAEAEGTSLTNPPNYTTRLKVNPQTNQIICGNTEKPDKKNEVRKTQREEGEEIVLTNVTTPNLGS